MSAHPAVPPWLLAGLALGAVFALLVVVVFVAGERLFPTPASEGPQHDGDRRRREEIRRYLAAIGESFREDEPVEGHRVAFYLPEREVAVTFDARAYLAIREAGTEAVLAEHEMPGTQLGSRLPFDAPTFGPDPDEDDPTGEPRGARWRSHAGRWASDAGRWESGEGRRRVTAGERETDLETVRASFAALGLAPDATDREVRRAYRERVTEVHPDQGGDRAAFRRLQEAYTVARDHAGDDGTDAAGTDSPARAG